MTHLAKASLFAALIGAFSIDVLPVYAADVPAACNLLNSSDVKNAVGKPFDAPVPVGDVRLTDSGITDTDCSYTPTRFGQALLFRVYVDSSPEKATELFDKLKTFYGPAADVSGLGDEAYVDSKHAIHVRKGNVRYFLDLGGEAKAEKPVKDLAAVVAGKL
jgi:hypothetical protein